MNNPKFEIGEEVLHPRTGRVLRVLRRRFNRAVKTQAIMVRPNGASYVKVVTLPDFWSYRLSDDKYWYWEEVLAPVM
jgi:hypothetical protein